MIKQGAAAIALVLAMATTGWAYEQIEVANGGALKGQVLLVGGVLADETVKVTKDNNVCGDSLPREKYVIGPGGGIANTVVFIKNIAKGKKAPSEPAVITNKKCAFHPHVQVGMVGQTLEVRNDDPMLHNTHMYLTSKTFFNAAMPMQGMKMEKKFTKPGLLSIECDVHSWMRGTMYVFDHPYFAVTDDKGLFTITDIPPGDYEIEVWHEALGTRNSKVTIAAKGTKEIKVEFQK
jgi:plastocyanin